MKIITQLFPNFILFLQNTNKKKQLFQEFIQFLFNLFLTI